MFKIAKSQPPWNVWYNIGCMPMDFPRNGGQSADTRDFTVCIISCVYRAELILVDSLRIPVLQYQLIKVRLHEHPWTAMELARIHKFQLPVAS